MTRALFIDAKGVSMPSPGQAWDTKAFLVDGAQAQPTGDEAFIHRVEAVPMKVMFEPKEGTDQPIDGIDVVSHAEIDDVVNYMRMGMHDRVAARKRRAIVTSPHWWDDKMLVTGKYEKDEFVARVMDHIADQYDGPVGSDPPTWDFPRMGADSDSNQPDAANFRRLSVGSAPRDDEDGISDEEKSNSYPEEAYTAVRSVVSIPKQAAEEAQENPKVAELKERLINAYPRLFSAVVNKNPPNRGRFGTARIKLKPNPWGGRPPAPPPRRASACHPLTPACPPGVYLCRGGCRAAAGVGRGPVGRQRVSAAGGGGRGGEPPRPGSRPRLPRAGL